MKKIIITILLVTPFFIAQCNSGEQAGQSHLVSTPEFHAAISNQGDIQLVDIRTPGEFNSGHIEGAVNIDWYGKDFFDKINELDKNKPLYIYCRSGNRSASAASRLSRQGFDVYDLGGGIIHWERNRQPIVRQSK